MAARVWWVGWGVVKRDIERAKRGGGVSEVGWGGGLIGDED